MSFKNAKLVSRNTVAADYFKQTGKRGTAEFIMSASALKMFGHCPSRFFHGYNAPESDSKDFGSLFDCLVLTPDQFSERYVVAPATYKAPESARKDAPIIDKDWNWNANACKEWLAAQNGAQAITHAELESVKKAIARLESDEVLAQFISESDRQVYCSAIWEDEGTGIEFPVRIMLDLVPFKDSEFGQSLADLKTTRTAAPMAWQRDCFNFGYHVQAALYKDIYEAATGEDRNTFCFVLLENYPPFETGKRILAQDFLDIGKAEYVRLLTNYAQCLKSGKWPGYDDTDESIQGWGLCSPEPFMASRAAFLPKFNFEEPANATTETTEEIESLH